MPSKRIAFLTAVELRRDLVASFDAYPFNLPAIRGLDLLALHPSVTFLVGENGTGKSTLLEVIAVALGINPEGGSMHMHFETKPTHSALGDAIGLRRTSRHMRDAWFLRAESFYNVATEIDRLEEENPGEMLKNYGRTSLHNQSHGESFFALFRNRFGGGGVYLLDEPEAALSPMRQLAFISTLHDLVRDGAQFIIATHSPMIITYPDAWTYVLQNDRIERVACDQTEHFRVAQGFMANPGRSLRVLLDRDDQEGGDEPRRPLRT
jgi:predicted ATPase